MKMPTEKTPLTGTSSNFGSETPIPFYVHDTYRFYSRRRRERQLQCIMFVTIVATFIMALIVTISYSVNHPDIIPTESINTSESVQSDGILLQAVTLALGDLPDSEHLLSTDEVQQALAVGNAAIAARRFADAQAEPLPTPSPDARHQYAVSTSTQADQLALVGVAEIAATRKLEAARSFMGRPSSFGSFLDGGWTVAGICTKEQKLSCVGPGRYRTFDGSCNHQRHLGMALGPYRRSLPPDYADGINAPRTGKFRNPLPSAREVSLKVHPPSPSTNPSFTVMLAVFGQFLDHDITATALSQGVNGSSLLCCGKGKHPECFPVRVGPGDPFYDSAGRSCMEFVRSAPAAQCKIGPREQLNQVSSFIDGSAVYGSSVEAANELREFSDGLLRMQITSDGRELLPASTNPNDGCNQKLELARGRYCFTSGDARANENLHLTTMHILWARQHNLLARKLAKINPQWDDEHLFQEARRIVGAQLQHITYSEFLPIVLGESEVTQRGLHLLGTGFHRHYNNEVDPTVSNNFAAAAFRFAHTLLPGLMKVTNRQKGTSSYMQLHRMLFNPYSLYSEGGVENSITTATSNAIQKMSTHVTAQLTEHLFEDPIGNQSIVPCGLDLVSLNIQRGRDHGLPGYVSWREYCGLRKPLDFEELKSDMDADALAAISKLYDNVDDLDLYTGALAEIPRGEGLVGPTFTCLIADQFERLQSGDKYWYETADQPGSFSEDQLREIRKSSLARIICDTSYGINELQSQVMRSVSPENPVISCEDIAQLSLDNWKIEKPLLKMSETVIPAIDWLKFENEVNNTLADIVSNILMKKPPYGSLSSDWFLFQKDINDTFVDLRNKFSALHPKILTNVTLVRNSNFTNVSGFFDRSSVEDQVNNTISEIINLINATKPTPGSLPADWLVFKQEINSSLLDINKKFKIVHSKKVTVISETKNKNLQAAGEISMIDWDHIRSDINATIINVIDSINASKPLPSTLPANWLAFRKKINDSLAEIKNKFIEFYWKPVIKPHLKMTGFNDSRPFNWLEFKNQMNQSLNDIITSIVAKKPPADSTPVDWLVFQKELNSTFSQFMNRFSDLHVKIGLNEAKVDEKQTHDPVHTLELKVVSTLKDEVNKTIKEIVDEINASRPPPGSSSEDWAVFRQKMNNTFANIQNKYSFLYSKTGKKKILSDKVSFPKLRTISNDTTFDIVAFREDLNTSLLDLMSVIKSKKPAFNSSAVDWDSYKKEIKSSVNKIKKEISQIKMKELVDSDIIEEAATSDIKFDWIDWKNTVNKMINNIIEDVNATASNDSKWTTFQDTLNSIFNDLKYNITLLRINQAQNMKLMTIVNKDWLSFKDRVNSTIEDTLNDIINNKPALGDPAWLDYSNYVKNRFSQVGEDLKSAKIAWFEKVKEAVEMMTILDLQMISTSSATAIYLKLQKFNYFVGLAITIVAFVIN